MLVLMFSFVLMCMVLVYTVSFMSDISSYLKQTRCEYFSF